MEYIFFFSFWVNWWISLKKKIRLITALIIMIRLKISRYLLIFVRFCYSTRIVFLLLLLFPFFLPLRLLSPQFLEIIRDLSAARTSNKVVSPNPIAWLFIFHAFVFVFIFRYSKRTYILIEMIFIRLFIRDPNRLVVLEYRFTEKLTVFFFFFFKTFACYYLHYQVFFFPFFFFKLNSCGRSSVRFVMEKNIIV